MRLVIDCFKLIKGTGKSIGIYNVASGIVKHLGKMNNDTETQKIEILVLGNKENRKDFDVSGVEFVEITNYDPNNKIQIVLWELFYVSKVCKKLKADRVFFPRGYTALNHPIYDIVLIHDLIPFYYNENIHNAFNKIENAYIMARLKQSAKSAKKIITISQASKADIIKYCEVNENKIVVINNACEKVNVRVEKTGKPYICAMTSSLPHKNAKGVAASYAKYCEIADKPLDLVIIGLSDTNDFYISDDVRSKITCYKYINNNDELYKIIGGSEVFLFLSLIEGFGLPPIEAMLLRVPVICSNTSSLPEVVGNAAILVDPNDYDSVAEKLKYLLSDEDSRMHLIKKGEKNISRFSWNSCSKAYWKELCQ